MRAGRAIHLGILLAWLGAWLGAMAASGWRFEAPTWWAFGSPDRLVLLRFGAAAPALVGAGGWHRLLLDPLLSTTLIDLGFSLWIGWSYGRMLRSAVGGVRMGVVFLAGGVAAAATLVHLEPEALFGGVGSVGAIFAAIGALLVWGLANRTPAARAALRSALFFAIFVIVFSIAVSLWLAGSAAPAILRLPPLGAGLGAGALAMLLMGPRRVTPAPSTPARVTGVVARALVLAAAGLQAARAASAPDASGLRDFLAEVERVEIEARDLFERPRASAAERLPLGGALRSLRQSAWLEGEAKAALDAYLDAMEPIARGDVPDPGGLRRRLQRAYAAWRPHETRLRHLAGLPRRPGSRWERF